jgi:hypothetical protein
MRKRETHQQHTFPRSAPPTALSLSSLPTPNKINKQSCDHELLDENWDDELEDEELNDECDEDWDYPEITNEMTDAIRILMKGGNVFIQGVAGTGKSTFIKILRDLPAFKNSAVVAYMGAAALNVKGSTIHSYFNIGIFDEAYNYKIVRHINDYGTEKFKNLDLIIIDEISTVRADLFDYLAETIRIDIISAHPFAGIPVCVLGDMKQLPPFLLGEKEKKIFR